MFADCGKAAISSGKDRTKSGRQHVKRSARRCTHDSSELRGTLYLYRPARASPKLDQSHWHTPVSRLEASRYLSSARDGCPRMSDRGKSVGRA